MNSPVIDGMDAISAFMSLPEVVQLAALGVAYSSHDMPDEVATIARDALKLSAEILPDELGDYLTQCAAVPNAWYIAKRATLGARPLPPA